jgi:DNA end-binding protein Ku
MPTRPTWSGSIQISLVSIAAKIFPATNPGKQVQFHQIDRKTHKRVHHQNVGEAGEVEKANIVKGFEYAKDNYIEIDPEELKALRLQTATTVPISQFVNAAEISPGLFDRPYFVAPKDEVQAKALSIMRKALTQTNALGIGEIAFSGREHLVAIGAPLDPKQKGLMLYVLRYEDELRSAKSILAGVKEPSVDSDEFSLAKQLIRGNVEAGSVCIQRWLWGSSKKLVEAKRKGKPLPTPEPEPKNAKVVNIMDALRSSLSQEKKTKKTTRRTKAA